MAAKDDKEKKVQEQDEETVAVDEQGESVTEDKPEPSPPLADEESGEEEPEEAAEEEEESATSEEDSEKKEPKKEPKGFQKRINEIVGEREEQRRRADAAEAKLAEIEKKEEKPEEEKVPEIEPKPESYDDYDQFLVAREKWHEAQVLKKVDEQIKKSQAEATRTQAETVLKAKVEAAHEKYADFEKVALTDVPYSDAMFEAVAESENFADVSYYLGEHRDEADRIARLSPLAAAREIGRIEERLTKETRPKKITKAPEPVDTVGSSDKTKKPWAELSYDEHKRRRMSKSKEG